MKKSTWNYRVMAHEEGEDIWFQVHEVYYDKNGKPNSYTEEAATSGGFNIDELVEDERGISDAIRNSQLAYFKKRNQSIIWAGKKFPEDYKQ